MPQKMPSRLIKLLRVVIDTNVLVYITVADLLLGLAKRAGLFNPLWSKLILAETKCTLIHKLGWQPAEVESRLEAMCRVFPSATVSGFEQWIPRCTNDEKDRHILAAAIEAKASLILTYNEKHFGVEHLAQWNIQQMHPQDFLLLLYERAPQAVWQQLRVMAKRRGMSLEALLLRLNRDAKEFAQRLLLELVLP